MAKELPAWLIKRLNQIACLDDELANMHLKMTGSYACFDEPGSVRIAREILAEADALPQIATDLIAEKTK
jgi:hypothetical protein